MNNTMIDSDQELNYEINSGLRKSVNFVLIPFLNLLPGRTKGVLRRTHTSAKDIIDNATTHKALEVLYGHGSSKVSGNHVQRFFKRIWMSTNNSKAVRNRLKLVQRELRSELLRLVQLGRGIRLVSIASGSSRAIIDSINRISFSADPDLMVTFVDKNHEAVAYSKGLARNHKFESKFNWITDTAGSFLRQHSESGKFNIVEMVGLMDYFVDEKAISIFTSIYKALEDDGILITANISDNAERPFVTKAVGWNMIYRDSEELANLLCAAGFSREKMKILYEPQKIHCVIIARK